MGESVIVPLKQALYPEKLFDSCLLGSLAFQRRLTEAGVALVPEHLYP